MKNRLILESYLAIFYQFYWLLFIWTNPVLAQNNGELITLSLKNKTIGEALETINKRYNYTFVLRTPGY